jgi:hypothetical protein
MNTKADRDEAHSVLFDATDQFRADPLGAAINWRLCHPALLSPRSEHVNQIACPEQPARRTRCSKRQACPNTSTMRHCTTGRCCTLRRTPGVIVRPRERKHAGRTTRRHLNLTTTTIVGESKALKRSLAIWPSPWRYLGTIQKDGVVCREPSVYNPEYQFRLLDLSPIVNCEQSKLYSTDIGQHDQMRLHFSMMIGANRAKSWRGHSSCCKDDFAWSVAQYVVLGNLYICNYIKTMKSNDQATQVDVC